MTSRTEIPVLTLTCKLAGTVGAQLFVNGPKNAAVLASAAGNTIGVAGVAGVSGDYIPVVTEGVCLVTAGAAIADNALVEIDASGRAVTKAAGIAVARVYGGAATALGQLIQVKLIPN